MNIGLLALKMLFVIVILFLFSLTGALTFPVFAVLAGTTAGGLQSLLLFILMLLLIAVAGFLLGKGIRTSKKPVESMLLSLLGAFLMGAILVVFASINAPYAAHVNLSWVGSNWYSSWLAIFIIGSPIMLIFLTGD